MSLLVRNVLAHVTDEELHEVFGGLGECTIRRQPPFAFVTYANYIDACRAINGL